jgi:predicted membrane protein
MVKHEARTQQLLRERDAAKRRLQVWLGLTIVWGVALGWVVWGLVGMAADDSRHIAWIAYLVPLAVLVIGTVVTWLGVRRIDAQLVSNAG